YGFLFRERDRLFPDELFSDLFAAIGRRSVPPSVVATVMVLQRLEGLSDRETVDRFTFDARWRYAAGVGGWDGAGPVGFAHTVLVDMRERLRRSNRPDRVFELALTAARQAGLVERHANNPIEADHSQLKHRLKPMRGLRTNRTAQTIIAGQAFMQNLRRGHYE